MTTAETAAAAEQTALIEEGTKKSGLVWVNGQAVWHAWVDGALCLVGGPGEQPLPAGLGEGGAASVTVRSKDKGGRLVTWPARVTLLAPDSEQWLAATAELKSKRLNSPHGEAITTFWADQGQVFRLTPQGPPTEHPGAMPTDSGVSAPPVTSATTREPQPAGLPRLLFRRRRRG
jgi:hypothetical protein